MASTFAPQTGSQTGRLDRRVRRSYLRVGEGASRQRISYSLEEALRLATLPGEEEGRIYCFRQVSLSGVPAEANRCLWKEQVQQALGALAAEAVPASDPRASAANAVYFNNSEDALETLLRNAVRATGGARSATPVWFANSFIGAEQGTNYAAQIPAILERLRPSSMGPAAAASILFAALGDADPVPLLSAIPVAVIRDWLGELDGQSSMSISALAVPLPGDVKTTLERAASHFGWKDPATVWLCAQAILLIAPDKWSSGAVVKRARATLRVLEEEHRTQPINQSGNSPRDASQAHLVFDDDQGDFGAPQTFSANAAVPKPRDVAQPDGLPLTPNEDQPTKPVPSAQQIAQEPWQPPEKPLANRAAQPALLGEATQSAGLFFLLNVLEALGIVDALHACPALAETDLVTHILRQLATQACVPADDPILLCLGPAQAEFSLAEESLAALTQHSQAWPRGFANPRRASLDSRYLLRVWTVATQRWLWRMGRLTLRDVIHRYGRVWLTRTDLDVTLPLASADLRIRRIGLDIDPGWLPWFGASGRVVRFHYRDRAPEETP